MWFVYAIYSLKSDIIYVGMTQKVERRVMDHNSGKTKSTKGHIPWVLFCYEPAENTSEARKREKYLKLTSGKRFLRRILKTKHTTMF